MRRRPAPSLQLADARVSGHRPRPGLRRSRRFHHPARGHLPGRRRRRHHPQRAVANRPGHRRRRGRRRRGLCPAPPHHRGGVVSDHPSSRCRSGGRRRSPGHRGVCQRCLHSRIHRPLRVRPVVVCRHAGRPVHRLPDGQRRPAPPMAHRTGQKGATRGRPPGPVRGHRRGSGARLVRGSSPALATIGSPDRGRLPPAMEPGGHHPRAHRPLGDPHPAGRSVGVSRPDLRPLHRTPPSGRPRRLIDPRHLHDRRRGRSDRSELVPRSGPVVRPGPPTCRRVHPGLRDPDADTGQRKSHPDRPALPGGRRHRGHALPFGHHLVDRLGDPQRPVLGGHQSERNPPPALVPFDGAIPAIRPRRPVDCGPTGGSRPGDPVS